MSLYHAYQLIKLFLKHLKQNKMPTKCIDLTKENKNNSVNPIQFLSHFDRDYRYICVSQSESFEIPKRWGNIELIRKSDGELDIMFAYDTGNRKNGRLFLGHWNDGVV